MFPRPRPAFGLAPGFAAQRRSSPSIVPVARVKIAPRVAALVALDHAIRLDQVEQLDIGRLARQVLLVPDRVLVRVRYRLDGMDRETERELLDQCVSIG